MAETDEELAARVLVVVLPNGARSLNEYVRAGVAAGRALENGASDCFRNHGCKVEVVHAESAERLNALIAEAVFNDEWLSIVRRGSGQPRAVAIGPVHIDGSPLLASMVAESRKQHG